MKSENRSKRNVGDMDVLKDIRGLLSTESENKSASVAVTEDEAALKAEIKHCRDEIDRLTNLTQDQQNELSELRRANEELAADLSILRSAGRESPASACSVPERTDQEIADLEAWKSDLTSAISELEDLLRFKLKELLKRVARIHQEAGDTGTAVEFRKAADQVICSEDIACFVQALARE